jgi:hypothetical protein
MKYQVKFYNYVDHKLGSRPLCYIYNKSISMGIFPDNLKFARLKPLYKWEISPI